MKTLKFMWGIHHREAVFLATMCFVLLLVNVLLTKQNQQLKVLASKPDRALEVRLGTILPPLEGIDSEGRKQSLRYGQDARKTLLFVFSPRCRACQESMPNWRAIIQGLDPQQFRPLAVSLQSDQAKEYAAQHGIDQMPVLTELDSKYKVAYHLALTPQLILIDAKGKAEKVWTGLLQEGEKQEIGRILNVQFP